MRLIFELQTTIRNNPFLFETAWKHRFKLGIMQKHPGRRAVEPDDEVLIDGYPRSANTFACDAFVSAQGRPIKMGNHFHSPAQFILARRYGIPAMMVLREPVAAARSWVVFREGEMSAAAALRNYVRFHKPLMELTDSFVIAPFEEVTSDFGKSIERLNRRFGTSFLPFDHTPEAAQAIFDAMEEGWQSKEKRLGQDLSLRRNHPSELKKERSREYASWFEHPSVSKLKQCATALYEELMKTL